MLSASVWNACRRPRTFANFFFLSAALRTRFCVECVSVRMCSLTWMCFRCCPVDTASRICSLVDNRMCSLTRMCLRCCPADTASRICSLIDNRMCSLTRMCLRCCPADTASVWSAFRRPRTFAKLRAPFAARSRFSIWKPSRWENLVGVANVFSCYLLMCHSSHYSIWKPSRWET